MGPVATYLAYLLVIIIFFCTFCVSIAFISYILSTAAGVMKYLFLLIFGKRGSKRTTDDDFNRRTPRSFSQHSIGSEDREDEKKDQKNFRAPRMVLKGIQFQSIGSPNYDMISFGGPSENTLKTATDNDGRQVRGQQRPLVYAPLPSPPRPPTA
ncbi:uncharacterized protein LOC112569559 [Pomacea canaliculata]|uniref:uncharacterized protein LOC112569559 n=1 Tax=Pomacea canaliculata TaxID=400727 RepID=UPI000D73A217|nr:uncharacterized protein LOC112569559 [Pomacea canaliculata]